VSNQDVGATDIGGAQQRVQVGDLVPCRARLGNRVTAPRVEQGTVRVEVGIDLANRARSVVGADMRKGGHARQDHGPGAGGMKIVTAPYVCPPVGARFQDHRGAPPAAALEIQFPPANIDQTREVARRHRRSSQGGPLRSGGLRRRSGRENAHEDGDER
jgi:hypothetical protein